MTPAPQRAQRVRGVPGVGLRTPDGVWWKRSKIRDGYVVQDVPGTPLITVRFCGRPTRWGNPFKVAKDPASQGWRVSPGLWRGPTEKTRADALARSVRVFAAQCESQPDAYFDGLIDYDYLSCFCPLDAPCHVDAIIAEGVARGIWISNGHHEA